MADVDSRRPATRRSLLSWILFGVAAILFIAVAVLYVRDRQDEEPIPTPPSIAGKNELINVKQALEKTGLSVEPAAGGARSTTLTRPGQVLEIDGKTLYTFIYPTVAEREADTDGLEPENIALIDVLGTPISGPAPHIASGSNVLVILIDGDDALAAKVDQAIASLP